VQPCHSDEFPSKVTRPHFSVLDKTKLKQTFGVTVPYWLDSLKVCVAQLKEM
jgi:dTDP-4-dehydrorhamnose reductase